jgi:hypothetical protein
VDAEEDVVDLVVLDAMAVAFEQDAGVDPVMRIAAAGDVQAAQRDAVGGDRKHGAAPVAADHGATPAVQRQRAGDAAGPA